MQALGDEVLREIARELVDIVRRSVTIDWRRRESLRAFLRSRVRRILRKYGHPPDKREKGTRTVLEQAAEAGQDYALVLASLKGVASQVGMNLVITG